MRSSVSRGEPVDARGVEGVAAPPERLGLRAHRPSLQTHAAPLGGARRRGAGNAQGLAQSGVRGRLVIVREKTVAAVFFFPRNRSERVTRRVGMARTASAGATGVPGSPGPNRSRSSSYVMVSRRDAVSMASSARCKDNVEVQLAFARPEGSPSASASSASASSRSSELVGERTRRRRRPRRRSRLREALPVPAPRGRGRYRYRRARARVERDRTGSCDARCPRWPSLAMAAGAPPRARLLGVETLGEIEVPLSGPHPPSPRKGNAGNAIGTHIGTHRGTARAGCADVPARQPRVISRARVAAPAPARADRQPARAGACARVPRRVSARLSTPEAPRRPSTPQRTCARRTGGRARGGGARDRLESAVAPRVAASSARRHAGTTPPAPAPPAPPLAAAGTVPRPASAAPPALAALHGARDGVSGEAEAREVSASTETAAPATAPTLAPRRTESHPAGGARGDDARERASARARAGDRERADRRARAR